jgi:hypothetical protein
MLETTFIGHQGWMFATPEARILVDPLLVEDFGHGGVVGRVYPPRAWNLAAFPPVDAVVFTHEHEDHFNIPSLNRLSRDIPLFMPERSSRAMPQIATEMGFQVASLKPGRGLRIADLELTPYSGDHLKYQNADEWETMPFLVRHTASEDSFFSSVDVPPSDAAEKHLREVLKRPGLWCYTNNVTARAFQDAGPSTPPRPAVGWAADYLADHAKRFARWGAPAASLICGGGFYFPGARSWMNRNFFPLDSEALFQALSVLCPGERFILPAPGQAIVLDGGRVVERTENAGFLTTVPREQWPDRRWRGDVELMETYEPACGRRDFGDVELAELRERLQELARFLYGEGIFKALYSLQEQDLNGRRPAFALLLLTEEEGASYLLEYSPQSCEFVPGSGEDPTEDYFVGLECYGSDLLELLRGHLAPSALVFGRMRRWAVDPGRIRSALEHTLWLYRHPLRHPQQYLELYRRLLAAEPRDVVRVRGRSTGRG